MSRGGGGPGQAHRRHHQVIVMVRVAYRLFPWCSIALCNCIDHHIVTGTGKKKQKKLAKNISRPGLQPSLPSLLLCCHTDVVPATENLWTQPAFEVVTCSLPYEYYGIALGCAVFRGSGLLNSTVIQQCAFQGTLVDGKIYGRGAQDMKSVGVQVNLVYLL